MFYFELSKCGKQKFQELWKVTLLIIFKVDQVPLLTTTSLHDKREAAKVKGKIEMLTLDNI